MNLIFPNDDWVVGNHCRPVIACECRCNQKIANVIQFRWCVSCNRSDTVKCRNFETWWIEIPNVNCHSHWTEFFFFENGSWKNIVIGVQFAVYMLDSILPVLWHKKLKNTIDYINSSGNDYPVYAIMMIVYRKLKFLIWIESDSRHSWFSHIMLLFSIMGACNCNAIWWYLTWTIWIYS